MKTTIFVMFLLCATAGFSQSYGAAAAVLQNQPMILEMPSHVEHASATALATPQYLNGSASSTSAQGVKPLWEFAASEASVSLGEVARQLRQQHLLAKKAVKVLSDQR
jgi:hypothetical protein